MLAMRENVKQEHRVCIYYIKTFTKSPFKCRHTSRVIYRVRKPIKKII